jgi:hypothetical protein
LLITTLVVFDMAVSLHSCPCLVCSLLVIMSFVLYGCNNDGSTSLFGNGKNEEETAGVMRRRRRLPEFCECESTGNSRRLGIQRRRRPTSSCCCNCEASTVVCDETDDAALSFPGFPTPPTLPTFPAQVNGSGDDDGGRLSVMRRRRPISFEPCPAPSLETKSPSQAPTPSPTVID